MKRQRWKSGDIVRIPLTDGTHGYGWVIRPYLIELLDLTTKNDLPIQTIKESNKLFAVFVTREAITKGHWPIVGNIPRKDSRDVFRFYMQDMFTKELSIYLDDGEGSWKIIPATFEDCKNLECFAVWDACHVEDRLIEHFGGTPRFPVDLLRPVPIIN